MKKENTNEQISNASAKLDNLREYFHVNNISMHEGIATMLTLLAEVTLALSDESFEGLVDRFKEGRKRLKNIFNGQ